MKTIVLPQISNPAEEEERPVSHSYQSLFEGYRRKCQNHICHLKLILINHKWSRKDIIFVETETTKKITCLLNIKVSALLVGFVNFAKTIPAMHAWNLIQYLPFHIVKGKLVQLSPQIYSAETSISNKYQTNIKQILNRYQRNIHLNYHPKYTLQRHQYHSQRTFFCCCSYPIPSS